MSPPHEEQDPLVKGVRVQAERQRLWLRDREASVALQLAQIGVLGWMIVMPMLLGTLLGRWIDGQQGSGVFWTAPLMLLGLALGSWSAWKWMHQS